MQMRNSKKRSVHLEEELQNGGSEESKLNELRNMKRRRELASSWLREIGVDAQDGPAPPRWGEDKSTMQT